ncbi:MAG: hypothetical protein IH621_12700 [Krumholzibacteria bacterium]|nr:hypothetical protein [Candidatus Krumholzibacteria bacterium]
MNRTIENMAHRLRRSGPRRTVLAGLCLLAACLAAPAAAVIDKPESVLEMGYNPSGAFILDGSYVMNVGEVQINITNWGLIGSAPSVPTPFSDAPSCQWPAGSGEEYLWAAGLWVGGVVLGERLVSSGGWGSEIYPLDEVEATIYEAIGTKLMRPTGNPDASGRRAPMPNPDDDDDGLIDEEILNGKDDDGDGLIDEDFAQIGNQMMVLTQYDNTRLAQENNPDHTPMNLEIVQSTYAWENDQVDDFVGFEYSIKNVGVTAIERVYLGFFADADIGPRAAEGIADDDMAGSWRGLVRASDGSYVPVEVGYMYDAAEANPISGYFGILFLGHDIDPTGARAPSRIGLRTFQSFSGNAAFEQGGDPSNDDEAYQLLSALPEDWDPNTIAGKQADFRFLVSAGPFLRLEPDESLEFQVGMVVGPGLDGLLAHCAEAALTWYGIWVDNIRGVVTEAGTTINPGQLGRETMLCREDFEGGAGDNPFDTFFPDYMDASCVDGQWLLAQDRVTEADRFEYEGKTCAMFNLDNCFECARQLGHYCGPAEFENGDWQCNILGGNKNGCTGVDGLDTQINWLVGMAPPPPGLRLWAADSRVHVFWDDTPEHTPDIRLQRVDFESYRVWRADNWERPYGSSLANGPESNLWQLIAEYDVINEYVSHRIIDNVTYYDTIPLGQNTGFESVAYTPVVLSDPAYAGLEEAMRQVVDDDPTNVYNERPIIFDQNGVLKPEFAVLGPWQTRDAALDTFWAVTYRAPDPENNIQEKRARRYYEYVDRDIHNGFIYFYSVTSTDHALLPVGNAPGITGPAGPGLVGDPGSSFRDTQPGTAAQTAEERERDGTNIYVYPNPATRDALAEYQQLFPTGDDPTGVRVTFTNLPKARNTVNIYTVAGDLVQTIDHDGTTGSGHVSWNLMSRNGQEIVSGVYLYSVQADDDRFEDFVGKFVVVR